MLFSPSNAFFHPYKFNKIYFSDKIGIDVGIVVGRLQKEGYIQYNWYNGLKTKYEIIYKDLNIEKNNVYYSIIVILLIFSLIFNTINIIFLMYLLA